MFESTTFRWAATHWVYSMTRQRRSVRIVRWWRPQLEPSMMVAVNIAQWWTQLSGQSRDWLVAHNGEPVDRRVGTDIAAVHDGALDRLWFSIVSDDGLPIELSDRAVDWIEAWANDEDPAS
ncbi:hypothetical protein CH299_27735 [Rhodococcus sp. 14-2686-1-2]|nr:hypothetical protein CH301_27215 [Rhodococcus sp. 15-1189-1-1a]OZF08481.1 hypothetical protein CH299_27735 [Rhodococcus sp. 14-2686-1-2]